ncbi:hypothetical protein [Alkalibacillus haloalkaliphilus]|uniref:hypothetical protein n=1 Tax=Alkalibacillus haloalkaliphilus TaxID=94136 RepID=UPI0003763A64|nr:hypothetical protein [Alkalibacillus haloalkaliphilus]
MRDVQRIRRIMQLLEDIWRHFPDWRFNQLVSNLQHMYSKKHNNFGKRKVFEKDGESDGVPVNYVDLFYLEDDQLEKFLEEILEELNWRKR